MKLDVKIDKPSYVYLIEKLITEKENEFVNFLIPEKETGNKIFVRLSEDQMDDIRDWISEKLVIEGFDENYNLTKEGRILQELEDLFFC